MEQSPFDHTILEQMTSVLGVDGALEIIDECLQEMDKLHAELCAAIDSEDMHSARRLAHQIKGAASSSAATALAEIAAAMEHKDIAAIRADADLDRLHCAIENTRSASRALPG